jgi:hypothetical protein
MYTFSTDAPSKACLSAVLDLIMHYECIPHTFVLAQIPILFAYSAQIDDVDRVLFWRIFLVL